MMIHLDNDSQLYYNHFHLELHYIRLQVVTNLTSYDNFFFVNTYKLFFDELKLGLCFVSFLMLLTHRTRTLVALHPCRIYRG